MFKKLTTVILFIIILLTACHRIDSDQGQSELPFLNLTNKQAELEPMDPTSDYPYPDQDQDQTYELNDPSLEEPPEAINKTGSESNQPPELGNENRTNQDQFEVNTKLSLTDFKTQWNNVVHHLGSTFKIQNLEEKQTDFGIIYYTKLNKNHELRVRVKGNQVQSVAIYSGTNSNPEEMFSAWEHVVRVLQPKQEAQELFQLIGISTNNDITNLQATAIPHYDVIYEIDKNEDSYLFRGQFQ